MACIDDRDALLAVIDLKPHRLNANLLTSPSLRRYGYVNCIQAICKQKTGDEMTPDDNGSGMEGTPLDAKARRALQALKALGTGWHSRNTIAAKIGKSRLNPVEIIALDMLVSAGVIERSMRLIPNMPQINHWVYRAKE